jgi:hypothetical protein
MQEFLLSCIRIDIIIHNSLIDIARQLPEQSKIADLDEFINNLKIMQHSDLLNPQLLEIGRTYLNTFIVDFLHTRYDYSNRIWDVVQNFTRLFLEEKNIFIQRFLSDYNKVARQEEYKQYKQQRDSVKDVPLLIALNDGVNPEYKSHYDNFDKIDVKKERMNILFQYIALIEISILRSITFYTQVLNDIELKIYHCNLNESLEKLNNELKFKVTLIEVGKKKGTLLQDQTHFISALATLSAQQDAFFSGMFPITQTSVEQMCNKALTDIRPVINLENGIEDIMSRNGYICHTQTFQNPSTLFMLSMMNVMFKNAVENKLKIKPLIYENTNYWRLYEYQYERNETDILLNVVIQILNVDLQLSNATIAHKYADRGYFDIKKMGRILELINKGDFEQILIILYQIFKIKFIIINMSDPGPDPNLIITGCRNPVVDPDPDFKESKDTQSKLLRFAFIINYQGRYYIPYNSKINAVLYDVKQLKSVGLNYLLWSGCYKYINSTNKPPALKKMYDELTAQTNSQSGGAAGQPDTPTVELGSSGEPREQEMRATNDNYSIKKTYSKDSKLSYYVAIDLMMVPGTSISLAQKAKLKCQMMSDNIRKSLSQIFKTVYVPTPIFITTADKYKSDQTDKERKRIIQYNTVSDLVNERGLNNLKGSEFFDAMKVAIQRSNRFKNAFSHLRIASSEYNSILKNHNIAIEDLNNLITDATYLNYRGGAGTRKATKIVPRVRKTRKQKF